MRPLAWAGLAWLVLGLGSCAGPPPPPEVTAPVAEELLGDLDTEVANGGAGGAGSDDPTPGQLTGLPGIDQAQELEMRILDARGSGQLGGRPIPVNTGSALTTGEWLLAESGAEYEITLRSTLLPDGIIRLRDRIAFLVETPKSGSLPRFRVFAGQASFYFPHLPQGEVVVLTPAGPLVTHGAVFAVTVAPDFQVLVTCREGAVYLSGRQNAVALPGQVMVADRLGRGRVYAMTPNESLPFADRWLKIMAEESAPVLATTLPRRLTEWKNAVSLHSAETTRFLALWFREARSVLGSTVPGPETWSARLTGPLLPSWHPLPEFPGLLGELP